VSSRVIQEVNLIDTFSSFWEHSARLAGLYLCVSRRYYHFRRYYCDEQLDENPRNAPDLPSIIQIWLRHCLTKLWFRREGSWRAEYSKIRAVLETPERDDTVRGAG
jgi:hypothetical protein